MRVFEINSNRHTLAKAFFDWVARHKSKMTNIFSDDMKSNPDLHVQSQNQGVHGQQTATEAFQVRAMSSFALMKRLADHRIGVEVGAFYARPVIFPDR